MQQLVIFSVLLLVFGGCHQSVRPFIPDGDGDGDGDGDADECAAMDARMGPDTCDGGGSGFNWNGDECFRQSDLCNCLGTDCGNLFETVEECQEAYSHCAHDECDALSDTLVEAFEAAVSCDPAISSPQCDSTEMITNQCGCPWAANNRLPNQAQTARYAWEPYEASACIPETCAPCLEPTPGFRCVALPFGTGGTCEIAN